MYYPQAGNPREPWFGYQSNWILSLFLEGIRVVKKKIKWAVWGMRKKTCNQ